MKSLILIFMLFSFGCCGNAKILEKKVLENNQIIMNYEKLANSLYIKIRELDNDLSKKKSIIESLKKENINISKIKDFLKICRNNLLHYKNRIEYLKNDMTIYRLKLEKCWDEQSSDHESEC